MQKGSQQGYNLNWITGMQADICQGTIEPADACAHMDAGGQAAVDGDAARTTSHDSAGPRPQVATGSARTNWPGCWWAVWQSQQQGMVRYNCADSLDRTNAASYFAAVQVCPVTQLRTTC